MYVDSFWLAASLRRPSVTKIHLAGNFTKETRKKIVGTYGLASFTAVADGCLLVMTYIPSFQIVARLLTDVKKRSMCQHRLTLIKLFSLVFLEGGMIFVFRWTFLGLCKFST
ncbi:unnamed protein product [Amoebophrya sp. A120]|nr:unnamed protein product [Amoebophrya sp. A120]|eukprot:GSA120T00021986001.1